MNFDFSESLMHLLHRASQIAEERFSAHSEVIGLDGLTARQFIVLAAIGKHEGQNQVAVTELTGIDRSTLTDIIGRLQSRNLVARKRSRLDARSYEVSLTEAGRRQLDAAVEIARTVDAQLLSAVPGEIRLEFAATLRRFAASGKVAATV